MQSHEPGQARDQPFQGAGAEAGDFDLAPFVPPGRVDGVGNRREGDGQARRQFCSGGRQGQAVTRADNEGDAEMFLKRGDLTADRAVGDAEFRRRRRHGTMARERLKGTQGVERRRGDGLHVISAHRLPPV
ncbi:hypothetical protein [Brevundimonas sp. SL161]|uniref:hypothetical protein n=1 Tax=Brevundimonas sp. SL161 TaxID=2804613 RepID=UPI003CEB1D33